MRIITHMRKFIIRTKCARHNEFIRKHKEYDARSLARYVNLTACMPTI